MLRIQGPELQVRGNEHVVGSLLHDSKRGGVHWYLEPRSNSTFSVDEGSVEVAGTFWHRVRTRNSVQE